VRIDPERPRESTDRARTLVYANSLLATLNTRLVVEGRGVDNVHETLPTFIMQVPGSIPDNLSGVTEKVRIFPVLWSGVLLTIGVLVSILISSRKGLPVNRVLPSPSSLPTDEFRPNEIPSATSSSTPAYGFLLLY
jgi:hypothetical protein